MAAPVGGDPSKPGAWSAAQIADWNRVANCDHSAHAMADTNPRSPLEACPACGGVLRTINTPESWADHRAEMLRDDAWHEAEVRTDDAPFS